MSLAELRLDADAALDQTGHPAYAELVGRNVGVVSRLAQERLRRATVLVAGCGSTGGAAVEPLVRMGVQRFVLLDPGTFELNNLNRQIATAGDIGANKAQVAAARVRSVNPYAHVRVEERGVTPTGIAALVRDADIIIDGVDVTTREGWRAKYQLHAAAADAGKPVLTGWDMAGTQLVRYYAYGRGESRPLGGAVSFEQVQTASPWQLMAKVVPLRTVPHEMLREALGHLTDDEHSVTQVVYTAVLFGAVVARAAVVLLEGRQPRTTTVIDLHRELESGPDRVRRVRELMRARAAAAPAAARLRFGKARAVRSG